MKTVFDTNIFVSALAIAGGQAERAIDLVLDARENLCVSKQIIHEVLGVLARKFSKGPEELSKEKYQEIRILSLRQFLDEISITDS